MNLLYAVNYEFVIRDTRGAYNIFVENLLGKRLLGRPKHKLEYNTKENVTEML
jgi:hypothetical protein